MYVTIFCMCVFALNITLVILMAAMYMVCSSRITLSAVNLMQIKSLIRNRTITKCLSFDEKAFLILPISSVLSFYSSTL